MLTAHLLPVFDHLQHWEEEGGRSEGQRGYSCLQQLRPQAVAQHVPPSLGPCHRDDTGQMLSLQLEGPAVTQRGGRAQPHTASVLPQD